MKVWWVLLRLELLRLARTREVTTFLLLPALLFVPLIVAISIGIRTLDDDTQVVALPMDTPDALPLEHALAERDLAVLWTDDPAGAFAHGEADAAVLAWREGEGLYSARPRYESAERWRWEAAAVARTESLERSLSAAVSDAGDEVLRDWLAASGQAPEALLSFASVTVVSRERAPRPPRVIPLIDGPGGLAITMLMLAVLSQYLLPVVHVSDRLAGVAESLAVTPSGRGAMLVARLVAFTLVELLAAGLVIANLHLLLSNLPGRSMPGLIGVPAVASGALFINSAFLLVSLSANNVQQAVSRASILLVVLGGLGGLGAQIHQPGLPFAGLFSAETPLETGLASLASVAAAALLTLLATHLFTGARALPPSGP